MENFYLEWFINSGTGDMSASWKEEKIFFFITIIRMKLKLCKVLKIFKFIKIIKLLI